MAVADPAIEPQLANRGDDPISVAVVACDDETSGGIAAALVDGAADLIVGAVAASDLAAADAHAYVLHGLCERRPLGAVVELVEQLAAPSVLVIPEGATTKEMKVALRAGVVGLVRESQVDSSLTATLRAVLGGQLVVPLELGWQNARPVLSRRQKQVLGLVVLGLSNGEIAAKLHLSEHTVKCHLYSGFRKLGVSSRDEAVATILDPEGGLGTGIMAISEAESEVATGDHR